MAHNLFIAVVLSTCLQFTALARTPQVVSLPTLPLSVKLKQFYQSLHEVLDKKTLWNKAERNGLDLKPLQEFLGGKTLTPEAREELEVFGEEYAKILNNEVNIADLLTYSEWQVKAEEQSNSEYIGFVDSVIRGLPAKDNLYLFTIKLTLADGTEVTLIKPGMSKPSNITTRVRKQISSLNKIAHDLEGVEFIIDGKSWDVTHMSVEEVNLVDNGQKYLDLNYGVTDIDVHRQLVANGYRMVHGIPNIKGGEKKEVFVKLGGEESNYVDDVAAALTEVHAKTYLELRGKSNGLNGSGISLLLPVKQQADLIFADIEFSAAKVKPKQAKLTQMLFEIKWYEYESGNEDVAGQLYDKFDESYAVAEDEMKAIVRLGTEIFLLRKIISAIQAQEEGTVPAVGRKLGLGGGYSYTSHVEKGIVFDLHELEQNIGEIKEEHEKKEALHNNLDDSIKLLQDLWEKPNQLELPLAG